MNDNTTDELSGKYNPNKWGRFPQWWCRALRGNPTAMAVAAVISAHADPKTGEAFPGLDRIAAILQIHRNRASAATELLAQTGIVTRRRGSRGYLYHVQYDAPRSGESPRSGDCDAPRSGDCDAPRSRHDNKPSNKPFNKPAADGEVRSLADAAWSKESPKQYPHIRNWSAFVASMIKKGEMPTRKQTSALRMFSVGICGFCGTKDIGGFEQNDGSFTCVDCEGRSSVGYGVR